MNTQMRKLAGQAAKWVCENEPRSMDDDELFDELYMGKFAELIVGECMEVAHPKLTDVGEWAAGMRLVQKRLKQHFGVEE